MQSWVVISLQKIYEFVVINICAWQKWNFNSKWYSARRKIQLQICVEFIIDNLEDFLLYDCFDSSIEGRCSVDKLGKADLDKCHLLFQGGGSKTPCFIVSVQEN